MDQNGDGNAGGVGDEFDLTFDLELWQFASSVIDFSSQYSATSWSAAQTLGASDTLFYGDSRNAWAPKVTNGSSEFLTVGFDTPVLSTGAIIRETFGNGFVRQVEVRDSDSGVFYQMPIGLDDSQVGAPVDYSVSWPITSYAVDAVRITIDTSQTYSSEEIDSVVLRGVVAPDLTGPHVVASVPQDGSSGPINQIDLTFSEPIDPSTFTSADVLQFSGPDGEIAVTGVETVAADQYRITFDTQDTFGSYTLMVGSDISDLAGNLMDQNGDGAGGNTDDKFALNFEVELWQYASTVVDYSSQYSWPSWSASQALGPSDTLVYGDKRTAWAPKSTNGTIETLTVGFEKPVFSTGAVIRETYGNGFVRQVELRDAVTGVFHVVPVGTDDSQPNVPVDFSLSWAETPYVVDAIRITIDTDHSPRSEEIDSVQLRGRGAT
jgi:methionine-rich copper-binding protein CopC